MSLVLSDSVTAALQSSMRRWMTVLTTCIWIGFKVSLSEGPGLVGPACVNIVICSISLHIFPPLYMVSANHCPAVSLLFFVVYHPRLSFLFL